MDGIIKLKKNFSEPFENVAASVQEFIEKQRRHIEAQDRELNALRSQVVKASNDVSNSYQTGVAELQLMLNQQRQKSDQERQELMVNITKMFNDYTQKSEQQYSQTLQNLFINPIGQSTSDLCKISNEYERETMEKFENQQVYYQTMSISHENINKQLTSIMSNSESATEKLAKAASLLQEAVTAKILVVHDDVQSLDRLLQSGSRPSQSVSSEVYNMSVVFEATLKNLEANLTSLKSGLETWNDGPSSNESTGLLWTTEISKLWTKVEEESMVSISSIRRSIQQLQSLQFSSSDGNTPQRRQVDFNRALPMTRSIRDSSKDPVLVENLQMDFSEQPVSLIELTEVQPTRLPLNEISHAGELEFRTLYITN